MECIEPGAATPEDLLAHADGCADARASAHIGACPACSDKAAALASIDRALRAHLYRADCPPAQTLGEYALQLLEPEPGLAMRAHLALCPHCTHELAQLAGQLGEDPLRDLLAAPGILTRLVLRLRSDGPRPLAASVRGAGDGPATYEGDGVTLALAAQRESGASARWMLLGLLVDGEGHDLPGGVPVQLLRDAAIAASSELDEFGNFSIRGVPAGSYTIAISLPERTVVVERIAVGAPQA